MTKFKVTVQVLTDFILEAENAEEAKKQAEKEARTIQAGGSSGAISINNEPRIHAQEPKDLSKPAKEHKGKEKKK